MNTRNTTPQDGADRLEVKAANIRKLKDQRAKALSLVKILQDSIFFSNAARHSHT